MSPPEFEAANAQSAEAERGEAPRAALPRREADPPAEAESTAALLLRSVQAITDAALADLPLDEMLDQVLVRVRDALSADIAVILLQEDEREGHEVLRIRAAVGLEEDLQHRAPAGFAGRIAFTGQPLLFDELDDEQVVNPCCVQKCLYSLAGVPLPVEARVIGVLYVGRVQRRRFLDEEVRFLQLAAQRIALAIERAAGRDVERKARAAAEAANRSKDEFLAMLGHELRNPLSAIRNAVVAARFDESRRDRALDLALRQTEQLTRLVDDLLDVARITQGRIRLRKERLSFGSVVERAVDSMRSFIEDRGHALSVSLPTEAVHLEGDPGRLEQVVTNLLTNAAKYTAPGGRIEAMLEREDGQAVLRVRDTGIGIKPEMLPRVFDLFTQSERTLDRAEGGLGIGLTIVRRLVELHAGRVEAQSAGPGQGAEFVVRIPAPPLSEEQDTIPGAPRSRARARILAVEDNPDAAEALGMVLEVLGHRVRVVHDGLAALRAARTESPDIVLVDIGLPGIDGYEVARRMRRQPGMEKTVLVALTGYGREEDKQRALAAGFDHHLAKPVDLDALEGLVAQIGDTIGPGNGDRTASGLSRPAVIRKA